MTAPPEERRPGKGYESSDVRRGPLLLLGAAMLVALVVVHFLLTGVARFLETETRQPGSRRPPAAVPAAFRSLERARGEEAERVREEGRALLGTYGWVDREAGIARIPIGRAMEILVERGGARPAGTTAGKEAAP